MVGRSKQPKGLGFGGPAELAQWLLYPLVPLKLNVHGAGRVMSRTQAKKVFTIDDHKNATAGVECRKDKDVIDETPAAYKDIEKVMAAQSDLVDIVHTLKQVVCVKG